MMGSTYRKKLLTKYQLLRKPLYHRITHYHSFLITLALLIVIIIIIFITGKIKYNEATNHKYYHLLYSFRSCEFQNLV